MKPAPFAYTRPATVEEAVAVLSSGRGEAKVIAGGQSLVPLMNMRLARPSVVVDINRIPSLSYQRLNGVLSLGAMTRQSYLADDPALRRAAPLLARASRHIGHVATRSRGTLGGSLAHADPAAELPATLLALDAEVVVVGPEGERRLPVAEFVRGYFTTALDDAELLVSVNVPLERLAMAFGFAEIARRRSDFALAGVVATADTAGGSCRSARVVAFGVLDVPVRLKRVEEHISGCTPGELAARLDGEAEELVAESLPSPSDDYRREITTVLVRRVLASFVAGPCEGDLS